MRNPNTLKRNLARLGSANAGQALKEQQTESEARVGHIKRELAILNASWPNTLPGG